MEPTYGIVGLSTELTPEKIPFPTGNKILDDLLVRYFETKKAYQQAMASSSELLYFDPEDPSVQEELFRREQEKSRYAMELTELSRLIRSIASPEPFVSLVSNPMPMMTPGAEQMAGLLTPQPMMAPNTPPVPPDSGMMTPEQGAALMQFFQPPLKQGGVR